MVVLAATLIAHLVWFVRLARSPGLRARSGAERALLLALALVTPVLSFYAVEIDRWRKHRPVDVRDPLVAPLAAVAVATLSSAAFDAARMEMRYTVGYRTAEHMARTFIGKATILFVAQLLLFMVARVIAGRRAVWLWAALAAVAFLLVLGLV